MHLADLPTRALVAIRSQPDARDELARRVAAHGPGSPAPADLARALGVPERTLRRVLADLDAAGLPVAVGWVRARGGGCVNARKARKTMANAEIDRESTQA